MPKRKYPSANTQAQMPKRDKLGFALADSWTFARNARSHRTQALFTQKKYIFVIILFKIITKSKYKIINIKN